MFTLRYVSQATDVYRELKAGAEKSLAARRGKKKSKATSAEGLFKQLYKCLRFLEQNPKHPGLRTHEFLSFDNPFDPKQKVWEAYVQNNTPGAYRVLWCYGPDRNEITILAILRHP